MPLLASGVVALVADELVGAVLAPVVLDMVPVVDVSVDMPPVAGAVVAPELIAPGAWFSEEVDGMDVVVEVDGVMVDDSPALARCFLCLVVLWWAFVVPASSRPDAVCIEVSVDGLPVAALAPELIAPGCCSPAAAPVVAGGEKAFGFCALMLALMAAVSILAFFHTWCLTVVCWAWVRAGRAAAPAVNTTAAAIGRRGRIVVS